VHCIAAPYGTARRHMASHFTKKPLVPTVSPTYFPLQQWADEFYKFGLSSWKTQWQGPNIEVKCAEKFYILHLEIRQACYENCVYRHGNCCRFSWSVECKSRQIFDLNDFFFRIAIPQIFLGLHKGIVSFRDLADRTMHLLRSDLNFCVRM